MTLTTKANIHDEVFYMKDNKITIDTVTQIKISIMANAYDIPTVSALYILSHESKRFLEDEFFLTKQELLDSL